MNPDAENSGNLPQPAPAAQAAPASTSVAAPAGTPANAQDSDRIEREWVMKTRQILLATHNDPYAQAQQIAALRADYLAKRYNKVVGTGE